VLLAHPRIAPDPVRVRLVNFAASALEVEVFAYVTTTDFEEFAAVREDVYLRFLDVIATSGTGFAFPSQTSYQAVDRGIDVARQRAAEQAVAAARAQGKLPFPGFTPEEVRAMDDTLDWPPKGSSTAAKR
jgi:MscS family membrane protein